MNVSNQLPATTSPASEMQSSGGIVPPPITLPSIPAVTSGGQNYANRMQATASLTGVGNGSLVGGGYRKKRKTIYKRHYNNVTKVMKGCNGKKTRRHKKNKRHNKRVFRGGSNISPNIIGGNIEVPVPLGASGNQIETLQGLTGGLMEAQVVGGNIPPSIPAAVEQTFSGGGISRRRHRNTKYKRLRYKKSIGRKSRSYRQSRRH